MSDELFKAEMSSLFSGYAQNIAMQWVFLNHPFYDRCRTHCPELGRTHPWTLVEVSGSFSVERMTGLVVCADRASGCWNLKQPFKIFTDSKSPVGDFIMIDPERFEAKLLSTIPGNATLCTASTVVPLLRLSAVISASWASEYGVTEVDGGETPQAAHPAFPESFVRFGEGENVEYGLIVKGTRNIDGSWDLSRSIELYLGTGSQITLTPGERASIEMINGEEPVLPPVYD